MMIAMATNPPNYSYPGPGEWNKFHVALRYLDVGDSETSFLRRFKEVPRPEKPIFPKIGIISTTILDEESKQYDIGYFVTIGPKETASQFDKKVVLIKVTCASGRVTSIENQDQ